MSRHVCRTVECWHKHARNEEGHARCLMREGGWSCSEAARWYDHEHHYDIKYVPSFPWVHFGVWLVVGLLFGVLLVTVMA